MQMLSNVQGQLESKCVELRQIIDVADTCGGSSTASRIRIDKLKHEIEALKQQRDKLIPKHKKQQSDIKKIMTRVSRWIRTGTPNLTDQEIKIGIKELEYAQSILLCMDGYFLVVRVLTGDLESLRELKYLRECV